MPLYLLHETQSYMCIVSPKTLIKYEELPKFNGQRIESIYAVYENSRYGEGAEKGYYLADILYYNCHVHGFDCGKYSGKNEGKSVLKVKDLPAEFKGLFGMTENKGKKAFITNVWFRMDRSGNGSFIDGSIYTGGWESNATTAAYTLFRGVDSMNKPECVYAISVDSERGKAWLNLLGKSFKVTEVEFADCGAKMQEGSLDFACKYPYKHTPIRFIDGFVYPDEKLPSWRKHWHMPYRVPSEVVKRDRFGNPDVKYLRVWDDFLMVHLYLERADEVYEGEELISVTFPRDRSDIYGSTSVAYCTISRFNEKCGYVYQKYAVTKINKDGTYSYDSYRGAEKIKGAYGSGVGKKGDFYRILKVVETVQNKAA